MDGQLELSTAGRIGKPVFPCLRFSFPFHSHIFFFFCQQVSFKHSIKGNMSSINIFHFYATLSFKASSWLVSLNCCQYPLRAPPHRAHIGHLPRALQVPRGSWAWAHLCLLTRLWHPQGFQLPGAWLLGGEEEHRRAASTRDAVSYRKKRNLVFILK